MLPGLDRHLRHAHRLYAFRGRHRPYNETIGALLGALLSDQPDPEAWRTLSGLALDDHGVRADFFLASLMGNALARLEGERRAAVVIALAEMLARSATPRLAAVLATEEEPAARHLALALMARLPPPFDPSLRQPLQALLLDRRLPAEAQLAATAALMRTLGNDGPAITEVLHQLVSGLGKGRSVERLRQLEQITGKAPAIEALCVSLEDRLRLSCPRCPARLRREEMVRHLWSEHRLLLDHRRVREPWALLEEWVDAYRRQPDATLRERTRFLAGRADPEKGLLRLGRLVLARGIEDAEARRDLRAEAAEENASLCPRCFALVPRPREVPPFVINHRQGRLSARGYAVEVSEKGLRTFLEVRTPGGVLYRGCEPGRWLTRRGATFWLVGPLVFLALVAAVAPEEWLVGPPLLLVGLALTAALLLGRLIARWWRWPVGLAERTIDYAWRLLGSRLHADQFVLDDSAFLAGLANLPGEEGREARAVLLPDLLKRTAAEVTRGRAPAGHLAALCRRVVADAVTRGADPVPLVAGHLAACFQGRLPLDYAEHLLAKWRPSWLTRGHRARLRVLLCDRAFEAGFEVRNLLDAGSTAPALGSLLSTDNPHGLAALRLLWSLRASRPWDRLGSCTTAFELASDPNRARLLGNYPNVLLCQEGPDGPLVTDAASGKRMPVRILLTVQGIVLQETLFAWPPRRVEVNRRRKGYELVLGENRFLTREDPEALTRRMERWFHYGFNDFLPQVPAARLWQSPDRAALLRAWGAIPCPECHRFFLAHVGEVGLALDEGGLREAGSTS
jgi:hypothetical protein